MSKKFHKFFPKNFFCLKNFFFKFFHKIYFLPKIYFQNFFLNFSKNNYFHRFSFPQKYLSLNFFQNVLKILSALSDQEYFVSFFGKIFIFFFWQLSFFGSIYFKNPRFRHYFKKKILIRSIYKLHIKCMPGW